MEDIKLIPVTKIPNYLTDNFGLKCTTHKAPKGMKKLELNESLRIYINTKSLSIL